MKICRIVAEFVTGLAIAAAFLQPQSAFSLPAPGDEHWATGFGPGGTDDILFSVLAKDGKIYVGGNQIQAGNVRAYYIACYDGTNWSALNNGVQQGDTTTTFVFALEKDSNYVYAGGWFTNVDNCGARNIARWDGTNWSRMGDGLGGFVMSLKWLGTNLYAGGVFYSTNSAYTCLARWAGTNWSLIQGDFTGGLAPGIGSITSDGTNLYVCGSFYSVNGIATTNVARWDGSTWSGLGNGIPGSVSKVFWQNNKLYAGGAFTNTSILCTNLAVWNGSSWSALGNPNRAVQAIAGDGTNVFFSGQFTTIGGIAVKSIVQWDGANWLPLGGGLRFAANGLADVRGLAFDSNGRLYAGGGFVLAGDTGAANIASWNGVNWSCVGCDKSQGMDYPFGQVRSFAYDGTDLYVGGTFAEAGGAIVGGIARWDGTTWNAMGNGVTNTFTSVTAAPTVNAIAKAGSDIYISGNFTNASGTPAKGMAVWNGSGWGNFGDADGTVSAMLWDGVYLWLGGVFTNISGGYSPGLALYQPGGSWYTFGAVTGGNATVNALAMDELGNVYVGGNFTAIGGMNFTNIAMYNVFSSGWTVLGNGVNNTVSSILATNGIAYVGGRFTTANGTTVNRITKWNGATWSALGTGATGTSASTSVNAIALRGSNLYIAGTFTNAGSVVAAGIAKWDGTTWSTLGSGLIMDPGSPAGQALQFAGDDLYVGGQFVYAGDKPSEFIARWNEQQNFYPPPNLRLTRSTWLTNGSGQFQCRVAGTSGERYTIQTSTNLSTWTPILTNTATLYDFTDRSASNFPTRVYRALLGP